MKIKYDDIVNISVILTFLVNMVVRPEVLPIVAPTVAMFYVYLIGLRNKPRVKLAEFTLLGFSLLSLVMVCLPYF